MVTIIRLRTSTICSNFCNLITPPPPFSIIPAYHLLITRCPGRRTILPPCWKDNHCQLTLLTHSPGEWRYRTSLWWPTWTRKKLIPGVSVIKIHTVRMFSRRDGRSKFLTIIVVFPSPETGFFFLIPDLLYLIFDPKYAISFRCSSYLQPLSNAPQ